MHTILIVALERTAMLETLVTVGNIGQQLANGTVSYICVVLPTVSNSEPCPIPPKQPPASTWLWRKQLLQLRGIQIRHVTANGIEVSDAAQTHCRLEFVLEN